MATNPKRTKQGKSDSNPEQENNVSDTATDIEAPEASTPAPEAAAPEAPAAPAEPKVEIDHEGNLYAAIIDFGTTKDVAVLQAAYREVPSPSRGRVQGVAMKRAMTEGGFEMSLLGDVLDAFNNLPAASKSSGRTKPAVDEHTAAVLRMSSLMLAFEIVASELGDNRATWQAEAAEWLASGAPEAHTITITKLADGIVKASAKGGRGGGGTRITLNEKLADLLARGAVTVGQVLQGANDAKATILDGGKVETNGKEFDNLSAAAREHRPSKSGDSKGTSTNGWDFWTVDGKATVGSLRNS